MKRVALVMLSLIIIGFSEATTVRADSNCDNSDPGNVSLTFE